MYKKVFKNHQVNMGMPFQVKNPINYDALKKITESEEQTIDKELSEEEVEKQGEEKAEEIIAQAKEEAELILQEAHLEAQRLIENAQMEIEELKRVTEEEARNRGYEDGVNEAKQQHEDLIKEAEFIRQHAQSEYDEVLQSIEGDAVNMVLDIARKVIGTEISQNKESVLHLVKQAFDSCSNKENLVLRVSDFEYEFLLENKENLLSLLEGVSDIEIKKDTSLKEGACIVETPFGTVDAGVQTKYEKIEEAFKKILGKTQ